MKNETILEMCYCLADKYCSRQLEEINKTDQARQLWVFNYTGFDCPHMRYRQ
jgi:hypothetical protein